MDSKNSAAQPGGGPRRRRSDQSGAEPLPASTLMVEIDRFEEVVRRRRRKRVLQQVLWVIGDTIRSTDAVFLNRESSFCVVLASTPEDEALAAADRIRANVGLMSSLDGHGVTVSIGVAVGGSGELSDTISRAQAALADNAERDLVIYAR
ncbi:MAG: diguanylate cyclase [Ilumatobacter sp.]